MLSLPLPNLSQQNKVSSCESQSQHANLMRMKHNQSVKQVDETGPIESTATPKAPPICLVIEENIRMRGTINDAVLTLSQWAHPTKDRSDNVSLLVDRMKESVQKLNSQPEDLLKAMAIQMEAREAEWAAERLAFQEKERVSKQMIFNLQQDNYRLRKARIYALTPRGPSAY